MLYYNARGGGWIIDKVERKVVVRARSTARIVGPETDAGGDKIEVSAYKLEHILILTMTKSGEEVERV